MADGPIKSLGKVTVTTGGTPVRLTSNESLPAARYPTHAILIQALPTNTGKIYVMDDSTGNRTTLAGVIGILAIPTSNFIPVYTAGITGGINPINAASYWVDADTNGEGVIVSTLEL